jgi:hypothetical protein
MELCEIEQEFKTLNGMRGEARTQQIKRVSNVFYSFLKRCSYQFFKRDLLNSFLSNELSDRAKRKIAKEVLNLLLSDNKIKENKREFLSVGYPRVKPLFCYDDESYSIMMSKNGFNYVRYFKYSQDEKTGIPVKIVLEYARLNDTPKNTEFTHAEKVESKPRAKQKVLSDSILSIVNQKVKRFNRVYDVL